MIPRPDPPPSDLVVGDLDEDALLALIGEVLPSGEYTVIGPGDDAAVVKAPDRRFVVSTDVLVEGHHFRRDWSTGRDIGRRCAAQNLADIAAMGAWPTAAVVALTLPAHLPVQFVVDFASGFADMCQPLGVGVVGGDLSAGPIVSAAVTVFGDLGGREPIGRGGAHHGDTVAVAGVVGWSAAGLALLQAGRQDLDRGLVDAFRCPTPPIPSGRVAALSGATAMIDISDGLVRDSRRIAAASGVRLLLERAEDVFAGDVNRLRAAGQALGVDPVSWVLTGGEDHGLLAIFDGQVPEGFRVIGRVVPGAGVEVTGREVGGVGGWDHFGGSPAPVADLK